GPRRDDCFLLLVLGTRRLRSGGERLPGDGVPARDATRVGRGEKVGLDHTIACAGDAILCRTPGSAFRSGRAGTLSTNDRLESWWRRPSSAYAGQQSRRLGSEERVAR